ncbi:retrovirus-related pol polyprotein from transposon tnt 1-94 [Cucumis melo var. makuwa]|uniref:Retrovirus-related pol polyprotein from transposon tnt 1-94 n=1 Tax=Cucumis melo var. makuwa TaxID=1194695 RepID=A0A5A7SRW0_CUCMM|nr:retrovirus-related pol polyprotein from transposon tnt 1-94 [Cucumis melo var. makuwa]TYK14369.1 retrovirus-related pol polyprotein from transposon tnt 1-94 [Cucumis melo var. makuwa]
MEDMDKDGWIKAMDLELESMYLNSVWDLVGQPDGVKLIGYKWIYKRKKSADSGKVQTFKARLVAKGYTQVGELKSIRILLSIAAYYDYEIWQMDVKTAFFNDNLEETIYMQQPKGFITPSQEQKICKLNRSIYELKQASQSWNIRFDTAIKPYDFDHIIDKPCVYKRIINNLVAFLVLYVDDILLIGNDVGIISRYQSNPGLAHWIIVKTILKYFRRTRKSTSGSVFTLNEGAVVLRSIKQGCIADSTMEAEYVAACEATKDVVWLRKFLTNLEVVLNMSKPITFYCDNSGAVANSRKPKSHKRGKYIEYKYHLIREIVHRGDVIIKQIASVHNVADPFTKHLTAKVFEGHQESFGLCDMPHLI